MQNLLDPAILFFLFGLTAGIVKSNLEVPAPIAKFLSLYLLMALGLKGGFALAHSGLTLQIAASLGCAIALAVVIPLIGFTLLRRFISGFDAAALAATYGSVSAVTFITATQYLETHQISFGGHMAAAMALMESPAIIMAVVFANLLRRNLTAPNNLTEEVISSQDQSIPIRKILHESFTDGAQLLLLGAMLIGILTGEHGKAAMQPFSGDLFKGMLSFFLLDMGIQAARHLPNIRQQSPWLISYAVLAPIVHAAGALAIGQLINASAGDTALLMVLAASASYIAVPAVVRYAIPEANPSLYIGMSLGITFPLNILFGIPLYAAIAQRFA